MNCSPTTCRRDVQAFTVSDVWSNALKASMIGGIKSSANWEGWDRMTNVTIGGTMMMHLFLILTEASAGAVSA
jgi:hypothetical protein